MAILVLLAAVATATTACLDVDEQERFAARRNEICRKPARELVYSSYG